MPRKLLFENRTCPRCGGSGEFSYCSMYGRVCFKCHGDGAILTARGRAANNWLSAKKRKLAGEIKVGDKIVIEGCPGFSRNEIVTVDFVGYRESGHKHYAKDGVTLLPYFEIDGVNAKGERHGIATFEHHDVRIVLPKERLVELRAEALAYEATLTKTGSVRKRAAKLKEAA